VQDSPADFFAGAHRLDAGVIIPDPRLQAKLPGVIASPTYAALHNPRYAVLANPATARFQNCTEPTLDVLMASLCGISDPARIKASIAAHFVPRPVRIGAIKRLLAPLASGALTTADHDEPIASATFGAIARLVRGHDLAREIYRITPPRHTPSGTAPSRRSAFRDRASKAQRLQGPRPQGAGGFGKLTWAGGRLKTNQWPRTHPCRGEIATSPTSASGRS
jgi:hypothetical protein